MSVILCIEVHLVVVAPASWLVAKAQGTLRANLNHHHRLLVVGLTVLMGHQVPPLIPKQAKG